VQQLQATIAIAEGQEVPFAVVEEGAEVSGSPCSGSWWARPPRRLAGLRVIASTRCLSDHSAGRSRYGTIWELNECSYVEKR
jgi:hypothetical protein